MVSFYNDHNYEDLLTAYPHPKTDDGKPQWLPRKTRYGSKEAENCGLVAMEDFPDQLIDPKDYKEVITFCHEKQIFPSYTHARSGVYKPRWYQDGLGYCWAFGLTAALMDLRAMEEQEPVRLAPTSLGWLVGWRNQGFFCDQAIAGAQERGIASEAFVPDLSIRTSQFKEGWEENALLYRPKRWWDTSRKSVETMIQHCISILATGRPLYVAFNWWSHALQCCAVHWDETQLYNLKWELRNSHGEETTIYLSGQRGVPDEAYGPSASN